MPTSNKPKHDPAKPSHGIDQSSLDHLLGYAIVRADIAGRNVFVEHIGAALKLRPVEFTILVLLASNPNATQTQFSRVLGIPAPNLTLIIDRLVERGLVTRVQSASDGRARHLHLSKSGEALARQAHKISLTMEKSFLTGLSPAERALLIELLHRVGGHRP